MKVDFWPLKRSSLLHSEEDLVMLDELNEAVILNNLRARYKDDLLYTWVGAARSVLVAVNPYKRLPLYGNDQIDLYRAPPPNTKLEPHVFDIANDSFNSMLFGTRTSNQSVLISGESGAGKTVATKQCLSFLARISGSERNVEERVIAANPLLEAFGNAQTIRNNNSSRFGKYIKIYFDPSQRVITAADIDNYLLEKARLVYQQKGERNFHVMYQLTKAGEYGLGAPQNYRYTNQSGLFDAKDIDDLEEYDGVQAAMDELGFSSEEKDFAFTVAAGILNLGNSEFSGKKEKGNVMGSVLKSKQPVNEAARLFGVAEADLEKVMNYRSISVRGKTAVIPLDPENARGSCDSLSMAIYGRLFNWLVRKVNASLQGDAKDSKSVYIGILDIFGFEIFEQNSFEQLCINYANEKLQQQFNRTTFKEEEALYVSEGIKFTHVEFIDNQQVLDMIEQPPRGILPMLDDECLVPEGSDTKFINKVEETHAKNPKFQTDVHRKLNDSFNFEIDHYAGVVNYNADGFMVKNRDNMFFDQYVLCSRSSHALMQELFPKGKGNINNVSQSKQFRGQLTELMDSLAKTESRYIRCIKPNAQQVSDKFESPLVVDQLRYSGVFEAVEIRRQGYPFRLRYNQFACKYSCVNGNYSYRTAAKDYKKRCQEIIDSAKDDFTECVFGKTMVLYRTKEHRTLTLRRELALETIIPKCQAVMRGHLPREMKRRCYKCQDEIAEALRVANDIDLLTEAIENVEPTIGPHYMKLFPGVMPTNLERAKRHREALQRWVDLEAVLTRLNAVEEPSQGELDEMQAALAEAKTILDVPRTSVQQKQYDKALVQVHYMDIKLTDAFLQSNGNRYDNLSKYKGLRDIMDYAKGKKAQETMCVWQKAKCKKTLTPIEDKEVQKVAKKLNEQILMYAELKKNPDPNGAALEFLRTAMESDALKDEAYCLLIKMTSQVPEEQQQSGFKCWDLLGAVITNFIPSNRDLELITIMHFRGAPGGLQQNYLSAFHETKYADEVRPNVNNLMAAINSTKNAGRTRYSVRA